MKQIDAKTKRDLRKLIMFLKSKQFTPGFQEIMPYPRDWPLVGKRKQLELQNEFKDWEERISKEEHNFEEKITNTIRYFEKAFEYAFAGIIQLSARLYTIFSHILNTYEKLEKTDNKDEKLALFTELCQFLFVKLQKFNKSITPLHRYLYKRKKTIIESISEIQYSKELIELLVIDNRICLIDGLFYTIKECISTCWYFIIRVHIGEDKEHANIIYFQAIFEHVRNTLKRGYIHFINNIQLSFKLSNVPDEVRATFQAIQKMFQKNNPNKNEEKLLTREKLAEHYERNVGTIRQWEKNGAPIKNGMGKISEVNRWIGERQKTRRENAKAGKRQDNFKKKKN